MIEFICELSSSMLIEFIGLLGNRVQTHKLRQLHCRFIVDVAGFSCTNHIILCALTTCSLHKFLNKMIEFLWVKITEFHSCNRVRATVTRQTFQLQNCFAFVRFSSKSSQFEGTKNETTMEIWHANVDIKYWMHWK